MILALLSSLAWAGPPLAWDATGDGYQLVSDTDARDGQRSLVLDGSSARATLGTAVQTIRADHYAGKRLRMTVWLRCDGVTDWAGAWVRVDHGVRPVAFDNMQRRALTGSQPWARHSLVLDVPKDATTISFGGLLSGPGRLWMDGLRMDVVDGLVPVTDLMADPARTAPANLDFE